MILLRSTRLSFSAQIYDKGYRCLTCLFNNFLVLLRHSVLLLEETRENDRPAANH